MSPASISLSPLSVIWATLVTSILALPVSKDTSTIVGSSVVFPSESSPSSLTSITLFTWPPELPFASTVLLKIPVKAAESEIKYVATYVSTSPGSRVPWILEIFDDKKLGWVVSESDLPSPSVKFSFIIKLVITSVPLFSILIVYVTRSPTSTWLLLLLSFTSAVFVTSISGWTWVTFTTLISTPDTSFVFPGLLAVTVTVFFTVPEFDASFSIIYVAWYVTISPGLIVPCSEFIDDET